MDGHHKLIRYKFVIHGAIDGYSRMIVFMKVSTDNRAQTVLNHFMEAVAVFGLPSRVRGDYGKENLGVKSYMEAARGEFMLGNDVCLCSLSNNTAALTSFRHESRVIHTRLICP